MTLEEAIDNAERIAHEQEKDAEIVKNLHGEFAPGYRKHRNHAAEQRQLAEWLKELKRVIHCKDCAHCDKKNYMYTDDDYDFCNKGEAK